jgi:hypothetical protein
MAIGKTIVQLHNISQFLGWAYVMFLTLTNLFKDGKFSMTQYWDVPNYRCTLEVF